MQVDKACACSDACSATAVCSKDSDCGPMPAASKLAAAATAASPTGVQESLAEGAAHGLALAVAAGAGGQVAHRHDGGALGHAALQKARGGMTWHDAKWRQWRRTPGGASGGTTRRSAHPAPLRPAHPRTAIGGHPLNLRHRRHAQLGARPARSGHALAGGGEGGRLQLCRHHGCV